MNPHRQHVIDMKALQILLLLFIAAPCIAQPAKGTFALTNARIETITRGTIERGTLVIQDGRIAAVGTDVQAPSDATVIDRSYS